MDVIDKATKEYFDEKFDGLREVLTLTVDPVKDKLDNHLNDHIRNDGQKKFNTEMWIIIAIFVGQSLLQFFTK